MPSRSTTFSNTVLISVLTFFECSTAPADSRCRTRILRNHQFDELGAEGGGGTDLCLDVGGDVPDLVGVDLQLQAGPVLGLTIWLIWLTRPTCTPRIMTLASVSITRPERSAVSVTGT